MASNNILIVDDDPIVLRMLESALSKNGYHTFKAESGEDALRILDALDINLVLLDVVLPGMDGLKILKEIRHNPTYGFVPVLMLTSRDSEIDHVIGLELGADDYISKPIRFHELIARIKAVLRRADSNRTSSSKVVFRGLVMDLSSRKVTVNDQEIELSFKEFELLCLLAKRPGRVFTRAEILDAVWSEEGFWETRTVDVHIRRIRKKLEEIGQSPLLIETVRNVGYRLPMSL
ncbi:response regulator transcription factor [Desulfosporosinus hippei]|uniref:Stage 0 sporulation protein A homolog n=1 Tax=Desulfosporosinus hippei DSM 8344 TaxID=1121419 RepID=A0A1G8EVU3_9FIRM|nr:response regulator transcription factor [Desulfosporosinus hippei]SDH74021.1 two-component system, OmpR family, alkaline phosphatase synthesis response regulator PhoP/two-component system, OmpR family, response regulator RegX3 [Desulfosporosinus hippei DSM 8344]